MGIRAILQRGRGSPTLVMPAHGVKQINDAKKKPTGPTSPLVAKPPEPPGPPVSPVPHDTPGASRNAGGLVGTLQVTPGPLRPGAPETPETRATEREPESPATPAMTTEVVGSEEIPEPASIPLAQEDTVHVKGDDLTEINGVGNATARRLRVIGITTYQQLVDADEFTLRRILGAKTDEIREAARRLVGPAE